MFVPGRHFQPSVMFASNAGTYPSEAHFRLKILGTLLALPTNIRLGWKSLSGTNTLPYTNIRILRPKKFYNIGSSKLTLLHSNTTIRGLGADSQNFLKRVLVKVVKMNRYNFLRFLDSLAFLFLKIWFFLEFSQTNIKCLLKF